MVQEESSTNTAITAAGLTEASQSRKKVLLGPKYAYTVNNMNKTLKTQQYMEEMLL